MLRWLTDDFAVAPQLMPDDIPALVESGVSTVICNRPDAEVPPELAADVLRAATEAAGLTFVENPYSAGMPTPEQIAAQRSGAAVQGKTVAYCASGTRSSVLWSLSEAGHRPTDEILDRTAASGYQLAGLRSAIDTLAKS